jgi:shikimate dehydrogenase
MTDQAKHQYAVLGNPIAHSRSPFIHRAFAEQTQQAMTYVQKLVALDQFANVLDQLRETADFGGCNVTLPFKLQALAYAKSHNAQISARALMAGAVNTLKFEGQKIWAENTDGVGMVNDITQRQAVNLQGTQVLLLGAGGAARGVILPLLDAGVSRVIVANRSLEKAQALVESLGQHGAAYRGKVAASSLDRALTWGGDILINATSSALTQSDTSLTNQLSALMAPHAKPLSNFKLAYDMVYGSAPSLFMFWAQENGCIKICDGLGMLVEQAAESFSLWRGVRPDANAVFSELRALLSAPASSASVT